MNPTKPMTKKEMADILSPVFRLSPATFLKYARKGKKMREQENGVVE